MAITVPPPQPYRLDWSNASDLDALNDHLATICANADEMFQQLYERPTIAIDDSDTSSSSSSSSGITTVADDTNVTGSISGTLLTLGWTGTLAAARLNANVVQSIVNDTNVTGSISAQVLTLAWTGTLGVARGGTALGSYAAGDILYASGATALSKLAKGTATQLLHSGTTPSWSAVDLAADVTGNLGVSHFNSGTGASSSSFWCGDGTWKTLSSASVGADSLSVSRVGTPTGNYNLSTLGTVDWFAPAGITNAQYRGQALGAMHARVKGGSSFLGFDWLYAGRTSSAFTQNSGFMTMTTTAGDDMASAILSASAGGQGLFENTLANGVAIPWGFKLVVPAVAQVRKLFLEVESFSCSSQLTVNLRGQGVITDTGQAITGTSATARGDLFEIDYSCPTGGTLEIIYQGTTVVSSAGTQSPNLKFYYVYITT